MNCKNRFSPPSAVALLWAALFLVSCADGGGGDGGGTAALPLVAAGPPITWTAKASMPTPRTEFGVATVNNKVYAIGGYSGSVLRTVEEYDPATDTWTRKADMPTARRQLVVAVVNNKIYVIGGVNFTSDVNSLTYSYATEEYDPGTDTWKTKASMPTGGMVNSVLGNRFIGGATAGGKIYVAAFSVPGAPFLTHTLAYDPTTNTWTTKTEPPFSYTRYTVTSQGNIVYALSDIGELAQYDPTRNIWIMLTPNLSRRSRTGFASAGGKLYSVGGVQNSSPVNTVQEFDPATKNWALRASMNTSRVSVALAEVSGKLYAIGGSANTSDDFPLPLTTVEEGTLPPLGSVLQIPAGEAVTTGNGQVTIRWTPVPGATSYNIYKASDINLDRSNYSSLPDGARIVGATSPHTITGLTNNKTYYFFVTAADGTRESEDSFGISATPTTPPGVLWNTKAPMPTPRLEAGTAIVNGKIYVMGGVSGSALATNEEYDPVTDTWTVKSSMSTARRSPVVAAVGGKIYVIGGMSYIDVNEVTYSYATEEYDPVTDSWSTKAPMPTGHAVNQILGNRFIAGATINNKIYITVFNNGGVSPIYSTFQYDPIMNTWDTTRAPVPFGYDQYAVASLGDKLYALSPSSFAEYSPITDTWIVRPSPPISLNQMRLVTWSARNKLYAIGGYDANGAQATVQEFDPNLNVWTTQVPLLIPRHSTTSVELGGKLYVFGGSLLPPKYAGVFLSPFPLDKVDEGF